MPLRNRFLVVVALISLAIGGAIFYYRQPLVQARIKQAVIAALQEALDAEVSIDAISIGLLSATVSNFSFTLNSKTVRLEVDKIRIGVGIMRIPRFDNLSAQDFVDRITLLNPKIKFVIYAQDGQEEREEEIPQILASELSKIIVEHIPFRVARIRNCEIEIVTRADRRLLYFSGLDGNLFRANDELNVQLSGKSGYTLQNNISINARITPQTDRQYLSVRLQEVQISSPLMELDGEISFVLDGNLDILFKDGYFPQALVPTGKLSVKRLQVKQSERGTTYSGGFDLEAHGDIIDLKNFTASFSGGQMSGFAKMDLENAGRAIAQVDMRASPDKNTEIIMTHRARLTSILEPKVYLKTDGRVISGGEELLRFEGDANVVEARAVLQNLDVRSRQLGRGSFTGFVVPGVNYSLDGNWDLNVGVDSNTAVLGRLSASIRSKDFIRFPQISLRSSNLRLQRGREVLTIATINGATANDTLVFSAKHGDLDVSGKVKLGGNFGYSANLRMGKNKIDGVSRFFNLDDSQTGNITDGRISAKIDGDSGGVNINSSATLVSKKHGTFVLDNSASVRGKQKTVTVKNLEWRKNGKTSLALAGSAKNAGGDWNVNMYNRHLTLNARIDEKLTRIKSGEIKANGFPATFFNAFDKRKDEKEYLIRAGELNANVKFSGKFDDIRASGDLLLRNAQIEEVPDISANAQFSFARGDVNVPVFAIQKGGEPILRSQRLEIKGERVFADMAVDGIRLEHFLPFFGVDGVKGRVSARINADGESFTARIMADTIAHERVAATNLKAQISATADSIFVQRFEFEALGIKAEAKIKGELQNFRIGDLSYDVKLKGDFLAAAGTFPESPVGGKGDGELNFSGEVTDGEFSINSGRFLVPQGELSVFPFARENLENVYADIKIVEDNRVSVALHAVLGRRALTIRNDYEVGNLTPFHAANLDLGVLRVWTDRGGIPVFLPGFMENRRGNVGYIETAPKGEIPTFTVASHPDNYVTLAGTLLLRRADLTFPLLDDVDWPFELDVFPYLNFDLDVRPADRTVNYFFQTGRSDRRRGIRLIECVIDPSGTIGVRGNDSEGTFRVTGQLRSFSGFIFFGRMFDRGLEIGLDFQPERLGGGLGYDNLPIIWGSAQTYSDADRFDRVTVRLKTRDPQTGELRERGRFTELVIVPEGSGRNVVQDEFAADFFEDFADINELAASGAGIGDAYISSFFLNYWGRQIARRVGLDMLRFETSIIGNSVDFLTARQIDDNTTRNWNYLVFANSAFITGKYIHEDVFLNYQTRFISREFELVPEHRVGIEYQPLSFLWMDFNYGFSRDRATDDIILNPGVGLQLRMPLRRRARLSSDE